MGTGDYSSDDIAAVRRYFDTTTNERATDEQVTAALDWFGDNKFRHMFAARSIVRAQHNDGVVR